MRLLPHDFNFLFLIAFFSFTVLDTGAAADETEVCVMSFNVRWDGLDKGKNAWKNRRPVAVEMIKAYVPDVIGLQEASAAQTRDLDEGLENYISFTGKHKRDIYNTFLYRSDRFQFAGGGSFWLIEKSGLPGGTRRCVWLRLIQKKTSHAFYVFNNHFDHRSRESRKLSARSLVQGIRVRKHQDPIVVVGDFNEGEKGAAVKYLLGTVTRVKGEKHSLKPDIELVDTFRAKYSTRLKAASVHGYFGKTKGSRIDFIFIRRKDKILDAKIIHDNKNGLYPSDHFPVIARVLLVSEHF